VTAISGVSTGRRFLDLAVTGGARALGRSDESGLCAGARADIVVLDTDAPVFAGQRCDTFLESWIFSGNVPVVTDVFVGGKQVVRGGYHLREAEIAARYRRVLGALMN
jgi:formimidoylglutamate deiminase